MKEIEFNSWENAKQYYTQSIRNESIYPEIEKVRFKAFGLIVLSTLIIIIFAIIGFNISTSSSLDYLIFSICMNGGGLGIYYLLYKEGKVYYEEKGSLSLFQALILILFGVNICPILVFYDTLIFRLLIIVYFLFIPLSIIFFNVDRIRIYLKLKRDYSSASET